MFVLSKVARVGLAQVSVRSFDSKSPDLFRRMGRKEWQKLLPEGAFNLKEQHDYVQSVLGGIKLKAHVGLPGNTHSPYRLHVGNTESCLAPMRDLMEAVTGLQMPEESIAIGPSSKQTTAMTLQYLIPEEMGQDKSDIAYTMLTPGYGPTFISASGLRPKLFSINPFDNKSDQISSWIENINQEASKGNIQVVILETQNPLDVNLTREQCDRLKNIVKKYKLSLVHDLAYPEVVKPGEKMRCPALELVNEGYNDSPVVTQFSGSKQLINLAGERIAYNVSNRKGEMDAMVVRTMTNLPAESFRLFQERLSQLKNPSTIETILRSGGEEYIKVQDLATKIDNMVPGGVVSHPEGGGPFLVVRAPQNILEDQAYLYGLGVTMLPSPLVGGGNKSLFGEQDFINDRELYSFFRFGAYGIKDTDYMIDVISGMFDPSKRAESESTTEYLQIFNWLRENQSESRMSERTAEQLKQDFQVGKIEEVVVGLGAVGLDTAYMLHDRTQDPVLIVSGSQESGTRPYKGSREAAPTQVPLHNLKAAQIREMREGNLRPLRVVLSGGTDRIKSDLIKLIDGGAIQDGDTFIVQANGINSHHLIRDVLTTKGYAQSAQNTYQHLLGTGMVNDGGTPLRSFHKWGAIGGGNLDNPALDKFMERYGMRPDEKLSDEDLRNKAITKRLCNAGNFHDLNVIMLKAKAALEKGESLSKTLPSSENPFFYSHGLAFEKDPSTPDTRTLYHTMLEEILEQYNVPEEKRIEMRQLARDYRDVDHPSSTMQSVAKRMPIEMGLLKEIQGPIHAEFLGVAKAFQELYMCPEEDSVSYDIRKEEFLDKMESFLSEKKK